jgi:hypothetical protein
MRAPLHPFLLVAATLASFIFPACTKERQLLEQDPDEIGKFCQIDTFNFGSPPAYDGQVKISYNSAGNPVSMLPVIYDPNGGEEFDDIYFRYDKYDRLVDFFYVFPDPESYTVFPLGLIDLWHRFTYPAPGIVVDSFYNYDGPGIPMVANPPPGGNLSVTRYEFDEKGRIFKTWYSSSDSSYTIYDRRGNVESSGITYDDKVNPYRTNRIWQLITRNYSMNNPIFPATPYASASTGITAFDKWGLPLQYTTAEGHQYLDLFIYFNFFSNLGIRYSCDGAPAGKYPF